MLSEWEIADVANERVASCLRAGDAGMPLMRRTPLWFYALRESEHPSLGNGKHLGPLASRIVMESIHAAIEAAPDGIAGRRFAPRTELGGRPGSDFTLQDLLTFVTTA